MAAESLFPSGLGSDFVHLDPKLQWVHSGDSRDLRGTVTVQRGSSLIAKILGLLTSLPPALENAPIRIQIDIKDDKECWARTYAGKHRMTSMLFSDGSSQEGCYHFLIDAALRCIGRIVCYEGFLDVSN